MDLLATHCQTYHADPLNYAPPQVVPLVQIEPTNLCNYTCIHCPRGVMDYPKGHMTLELFKTIIDQFVEVGWNPLIKFFFLGEPMLNPNYVEMLQYAHDKNVRMMLETNGSLLTEELSRQLLPIIRYLNVSIDGLDKETYEKVRVGGDFDQVRENLKTFISLKSKMNPEVQFAITTILPIGADRQTYYHAFKRVWTDVTDVITVTNHTDYDGTSWINAEGEIVPSKVVGSRKQPCPYGLQGLVVRFNGTITFCCGDYNTEHILGNANYDNLFKVWRSKKLQKIHSALRRGAYSSLPACLCCGSIGRTAS